MIVNVIAFGFKFGAPHDVDLLFDVRFLRNPNYDAELQPRTGMDAAVGAYIEADPSLEPFLERLFALLDFLLPRYLEGGRPQLAIGIGCTGGKHRSVYIAKRLLEHIKNGKGTNASEDKSTDADTSKSGGTNKDTSADIRLDAKRVRFNLHQRDAAR